MACQITINSKIYTEPQFKKLLKAELLYEALDRGLITLPVETSAIQKPTSRVTSLRGNFPLSMADIVLSMKNIFGLDTKEANASASLIDHMANAWAKRNGKTVEDFYRTIVFVKPEIAALPEVSENLLFAGLSEFTFTDMMEFGNDPSSKTNEFEDEDSANSNPYRSSFIVKKDGKEVGIVEINRKKSGKFYISWLERTGGVPGTGAKIFRTVTQNLINKGAEVDIDNYITSGGFRMMQVLADEGFLIQTGQEITEPNQRSKKPMHYKRPPFKLSPSVVPDNTPLLFQAALKDSGYTPTESAQLTKEKEEAKKEAIKNGTFLKAPNGKKTNLNEDQWLTVQTPTFKNWFKDSKVLDSNGEPAVMYHGTNNVFSEFSEQRREGQRQYSGIFVTPEIFFAEDYLTPNKGHILELFAKSSNPFDYDNPVHVKLATEAGFPMSEVADTTKDSNWAILERGTFQKFIQENNFDGYYTKEGGVKNLAVYRSAQLKVSDGRNQTFLANSDNIFFQQGLLYGTSSDLVGTVEETEQLLKEKEEVKLTSKSNGTFLKTPSGASTNLTEDQWLTVRTPTFKKLFGDWEATAPTKHTDTLVFPSAEDLVNSKSPLQNKETVDEISKKESDLNNLIKCLWA